MRSSPMVDELGNVPAEARAATNSIASTAINSNIHLRFVPSILVFLL